MKTCRNRIPKKELNNSVEKICYLELEKKKQTIFFSITIGVSMELLYVWKISCQGRPVSFKKRNLHIFIKKYGTCG